MTTDRLSHHPPLKNRLTVFGGKSTDGFLHQPGVDSLIRMVDHATDTSYAYVQDGRNSVYQIQQEAFPYPVVKTYQYDSFGNITSETGDLENPFAYTGREWEPELGLYYYRARWYDPAVGRFLSEDPIGFDGDGPNLFAYVLNNPVNFTDPLGLWTLFGSFGVRGTTPIGAAGDVGIGGYFGTSGKTYDFDIGVYAMAFPGGGVSIGKGFDVGFFSGDACEFKNAHEVGIDTPYGGISILSDDEGNFGISISGPSIIGGTYTKGPDQTIQFKDPFINQAY